MEACELSIELLQNGIGHTMSIHTEDVEIVKKFAKKPASRILVNTGGSFGGTGASTGLMPSFTLGCGTWGGSSVSENVTPMHLINIKRVAYGLIDCDKIGKDRGCCEETCNTRSFENNNLNTGLSFGSSEMNLSPAEIQRRSTGTVDTNNTIIEKVSNLDNEEVMDLVNKIIATMKK